MKVTSGGTWDLRHKLCPGTLDAWKLIPKSAQLGRRVYGGQHLTLHARVPTPFSLSSVHARACLAPVGKEGEG